MQDLLDLLGFSQQKIGYRELIVSAIGGFFAIAGIFMASYWLFGTDVSVLIVPSMGASAVLLFAAPHAPFSQPWNVVVGHAISAIIGVACWQWIPNLVIAASCSVALAIAAMYLTRSIHPPGGATALAAVIGSEQLHALSFSYEFQPILFNVVVMLLIAIVFNGLFHWRRYPAHSPFREKPVKPKGEGYAAIKHEDFVYALSQIDTFVDITEEDLLKIYQLATKRHPGTSQT